MIPYKCPICEGHGIVPPGFYQTTVGQSYSYSNASFETCRACHGQGIIWGHDEEITTNNQSNFQWEKNGMICQYRYCTKNIG